MAKKILIVDDEPDILVPLQFFFERNGYDVMTAQSGEHGLDLIYEYEPDLVLLDIILPGIDGYEICEIVRLNPDYRNIKIIFLTAKDSEVEIAKGLALGADAYFPKPFERNKLVAKIRELLDDRLDNVSK